MISETVWSVKGHGVHSAYLEMTAGLSQLRGVDVKVNTFRKADITHIQTIGPYALLQLLFARNKKVISVHVIPDSFVGSIIGSRWWYQLAVIYLRFLYNRGDRLLAVSQEVKDQLINQLHIKKPIEVFFNTIGSRQFATTPELRQQARRELGLTAQDFAVIGNGQVQPRKRFDIFLKLAQTNPGLRFFWAGGIPFKHLGADYNAMQKLIASAPPNLTVTGVIGRDQVKRYFNAGDAFLLPSEQENHPVAMLEAAAAGLPVIVRDLHAYDSAFGDKVLRGTDQTFIDIILKLKNDREFRRLAISNAADIANRFDNLTGSKQLLEIYKATLAAS